MSEHRKVTAAAARALTGNLWLDRHEAAEYMNVSEKFLATHLRDGPRMTKVGSKVLYRLADIDNWMKQQEIRL